MEELHCQQKIRQNPFLKDLTSSHNSYVNCTNPFYRELQQNYHETKHSCCDRQIITDNKLAMKEMKNACTNISMVPLDEILKDVSLLNKDSIGRKCSKTVSNQKPPNSEDSFYSNSYHARYLAYQKDNNDQVPCVIRHEVSQSRQVFKEVKSSEESLLIDDENIREEYENDKYIQQNNTIYSQEFVNKIILKNNRLKSSLQKLIDSKKKEKHNVAWTNYINELKSKHREDYENREQDYIFRETEIDPKNCHQYVASNLFSDSNRKVFKELYNPYEAMPEIIKNKTTDLGDDELFSKLSYHQMEIFRNDQFCCPISSQAEHLLLQRAKNEKNMYLENSLHVSNNRNLQIKCSPIQLQSTETKRKIHNINNKNILKPANVVEYKPNIIDNIEFNNGEHLQSKSIQVIDKTHKEVNLGTSVPITFRMVKTSEKQCQLCEKFCNQKEKDNYQIQPLLFSFNYKDKVRFHKGLNAEANKASEHLTETVLEDRSTGNYMGYGRQLSRKNFAFIKTAQITPSRSFAAQTDKNCNIGSLPKKIESVVKKEGFKNKYYRISNDIDSLKRKIDSAQKIIRNNTLTNIQQKIEELLKSIDSFVIDVKSNRSSFIKNKTTSSIHLNESLPFIASNANSFGFCKPEHVVCMLTNKSDNFKNIYCNNENVERTLLFEDIDKNNQATRDTVPISKKITDSEQKSCKIFTSEHTTETEINSVASEKSHEKSSDDVIKADGQMTIAVNTDPIGLLALLRISSEAVKNLMSYVPTINYQSYLPIPKISKHRNESYICNFCGANFERPSELSDHIQAHDLGSTRDCCVCRHILEESRNKMPSLFSCKHCGMKFTRAYCCELHQHSCANRLGIKHDVPSSLIILT